MQPSTVERWTGLEAAGACMQVNYYPKWHEGRGDTKVAMQKWGKHPHHGRVRDLQFQVKIKGVRTCPPCFHLVSCLALKSPHVALILPPAHNEHFGCSTDSLGARS